VNNESVDRNDDADPLHFIERDFISGSIVEPRCAWGFVRSEWPRANRFIAPELVSEKSDDLHGPVWLVFGASL
jgi:hypothetical protein